MATFSESEVATLIACATAIESSVDSAVLDTAFRSLSLFDRLRKVSKLRAGDAMVSDLERDLRESIEHARKHGLGL
jgi:hypothetical protein